MPIEGLPGSNQQAAFGGAGGVASTGFDRIFSKDKKNNLIDSETQAKFKNVLVDMISTDATPEVDTKRERKPMEEQLLYQEELKRISDNKLRSITKTPEERKKHKEEKEEEGEENASREQKEPLSAEEYLSTADKMKMIEEDLLKNYIALTAKQMVGRPKNAMEGVRVDLGALRNQLLAQGFLMNDFTYLDHKTAELIKESFLRLIKDKFNKSPETPIDMIDWILNAKTGRSIMELLSLLEKDVLTPTEKNDILRTFEIPDLVQIASYMKLDIDSWMSILQKESIKIRKEEGLDMFFHILEEPQLRDISVVIDGLRMSTTAYLMEDNIFKKIGMYLKLQQTQNELYKRGVGQKSIEEIKTQSRKIAWIRTITHLKETHLNRILTTSSIEFTRASRKIERLTKRAKKLGYDIPQEGIKWIETGLIKLGLETAQYKLELLKSLQKISYDPKREKDISRLAKIIADLERKMPSQEEK